MKKFIAMLLAMGMVLLCCSCSSNTNEDIAVLTYRLEQAENTIAELEERVSILEEAQASAQTPVENTEKEPEVSQENEAPTELQSETVTSDAQALLVKSLHEYKGSAAYIKCANDENRIELQFATEYRVANLEGHKIHVILAAVDTNREVYGVDAGNVLIDMNTGVLYHEKTLDVADFIWENISSYEDALTGALAVFGSWRAYNQDDPYIMTDTEYRDDFTADQIAAINELLN